MATGGLKLYSDYKCATVGQIIITGVAGVFGTAATLSNWGRYDYWTPYPIYFINGRTAGADSFVLSGGDALYNNSVPQTIPTGDNITYDYSSNSAVTKDIGNAFFVYRDEDSSRSYWLSITANTDGTEYGVSMAAYTQTPADGERETWNYFSTYMRFQRALYMRVGQDITSSQNQVKVYKATIEDTLFYIFAFGVSATNTYNAGSTVSTGTNFVAIPADYFEGKIPDNYAGNESESNSSTSYTPTTPYRGSVSPRDLTNKRNPYGFNAGNGLSLAIIDYAEYAAILQGIYAGTAESVLNKIAQGFAQISGGNTHRPVDEVQAITNAVLSCHMIPQIVGYISGAMTLKTIAGYHILGGNGDSDITMSIYKTDNTIFEYTTSTYYIQRRLNSFLDFEPYTSISLHIPFVPVVDIKPSILYGNGLKLHFVIDIYTGVLSVDVIIVDNGATSADIPREFILTTMQTNVKTDIPIIGNAAQSGIFSSLTSAIIGAVGAEDFSGVAGGAVATADQLSKMSTGVAVGKSKIDGIGAYLSNRQPYLIITRPSPAVPTNYLTMIGNVSNIYGVIGDFKGYAEFDTVDLTNINLTDSEKTELESMLKSGVIV